MRGDDDVSLTSTGFYRSYGTGTRFSFNKGSSTYETLKAQEEDGACGGFHCSQAAAPQQGANGGFALRRVFIATGVLVLLAVGVSLVKDTRAVSTSVVGSLGAGKEEVPSKISMSVKENRHPLVKSGSTSSISSLAVRATNEYGEFDKVALNLYSLQMVVEPFRDTVLTVVGSTATTASSAETSFQWRIIEADENGDPLAGIEPVLDVLMGPETRVTLTKPGTVYDLVVKAYHQDGTLAGVGRFKVACKYVRREIRTLSDHDREAFLDALEIFYTVPTDVGQQRYGSKFFNYERITAYHDSKISDFCYHGGMQFLTSHAAFDLVLERYLQMIDPTVTIPIWDFMIESATMGEKWYDSVIFKDDWFGSAIGSAENQFMVTGGRFGNVSTIFDPDDSLVNSRVRPNHNAYGYITSVSNYQDLPRLTRTTSYCGLISHATFATAEVFVACFHDSDNLYDWEQCMENNVHGNLHGLLGGAFNCNTDMKAFAEQHSEYSKSLLSFVLEDLTLNYWPMNRFLPSANSCDSECTKGQEEKCGCTCLIDAFEISDDEVYDYATDFMEGLVDKFNGVEYIDLDLDAKYPYGFKQDGERLNDEMNLLLMRYVIKIGCEPSSVGYMSTGASPLDPIFWVLHPMFEKAMHILWLSPSFRDAYTFEWVDGTCSGSAYYDELPFTEKWLGFGNETAFLTNKELLELMHPSNPQVPYIYENFAQWGNTDSWDPCPECSPREDEEER